MSLIVDFATMPAEMRLAVIAGLIAVPGIVVSILRGVLAGFTAELPPGFDILVSAIPEALFAAAPVILAVWGMIIPGFAKVAMWVGLACAAVLVVLGGIRVTWRWLAEPLKALRSRGRQRLDAEWRESGLTGARTPPMVAGFSHDGFGF